MSTKVVRCYGARKRAIVVEGTIHSKDHSAEVRAFAISNIGPNVRSVESTSLTWTDALDPSVSVNVTHHEDRIQNRQAFQPLASASIFDCYNDDNIDEEWETKQLAKMAQRRKISRTKSKSSEAEKISAHLLEIAISWFRWVEQKWQNTTCKKAKSHFSKPFDEAAASDKCLHLLRSGADPAVYHATGTCPFLCFAQINSDAAYNVLMACLDGGIDPNASHQINRKGALDLALEAGNARAVLCLLERGGRPLVVPSTQAGCSSVLFFASLHGFARKALFYMSRLLLEAVEEDAPDNAAKLLAHGFRATFRDKSGRTPLQICVEDGKSVRMTQVLLDGGADPNTDCGGVPVGIYALIRGDRAVFRLLAQRGLDPNRTEAVGGDTVREVALASGWSLAELDSLFPACRPVVAAAAAAVTPPTVDKGTEEQRDRDGARVEMSSESSQSSAAVGNDGSSVATESQSSFPL